MENLTHIGEENLLNIHDTVNRTTLQIQHPNKLYFISLPLVVTLLILIHIVGFFGNGAIVLIFAKKRGIQSYTNWMVVNLAVCDLVVVIFCIPLDIPLILKQKWIYGKFFCRIYYPIGTVPLLSSVFTLVTIAYTRYRGITYPYAKQPSRYIARVVIIVIWTLSFLLVSPLIIILRYSSEYEFCYEHWKPSLRRIYSMIIFLFGYGLPLAIITFAYTFIVYEISMKEKRTLMPYRDACRSKENRKLIKLSFIVTVTFAVCILPNQLVFLFYEFGNLAAYKYNVDLRLLSHVMLFLNSAVNPIIYNVFSERFRTGFKELITRAFRFVSRMTETKSVDLNRSFTLQSSIRQSSLRSIVERQRCFDVKDQIDKNEVVDTFAHVHPVKTPLC